MFLLYHFSRNQTSEGAAEKGYEHAKHKVEELVTKIEVEMADCIPVVRPVLLGGTVYIIDIDPDAPED